MKYPRLRDGEGAEIDPHPDVKGAFGPLKFMCCDCGLVHMMGFAVEKNGKLGLAIQRDKRATAMARRAKGIKGKGNPDKDPDAPRGFSEPEWVQIINQNHQRFSGASK